MCKATRLDEPFGDDGCPNGRDRGAVDADRGRCGGGMGGERIAWRVDRELAPEFGCVAPITVFKRGWAIL